MDDLSDKSDVSEICQASATVGPADFRGLKRLAEAAGDQFAFGVVLYDHDRPVPFGDRMWAIPLSALG